MAVTAPPPHRVSGVVASSPSPPATTSPSTNTTVATSPATRCRYKTGRCMNARVAKPNGTLLLLCELHRDQQNRTKKRSDLKYRHDRSKKRRDASAQLLTVTAVHHQGSLLHHQPSPVAGTPVGTPSSSTMATDDLKRTALYKLSSGLRSAAIGNRISPGKLRVGPLRTRSFDSAISLHRRDIVAMASPHKPMAGSTPSTPTVNSPMNNLMYPHSSPMAPPSAPSQPQSMVFPPMCLSPIPQNCPWTARGWQPEDVRILEYFIL